MLRGFGGVAAVGPDGPVDLGGPKQRAVLALLMLDPGAVVTLDRIVDRIWGDAPPARAEVSVRGYVSNLRKALATAGIVADPVIDFRDRGYVLLVRPDVVDLHRFNVLVDDGIELQRGSDQRGARRLLDRALELHAGPALGTTGEKLGLDDVRAHYDERRGDAVEALVDARLALGEHAQLPAVLASEIARQPYRERLRAQLALALYRAGRSVEALRAIADARRLLRDDIGVEPGPELRQLEAAILAHDDHRPGVDPASRRCAALGRAARRGRRSPLRPRDRGGAGTIAARPAAGTRWGAGDQRRAGHRQVITPAGPACRGLAAAASSSGGTAARSRPPRPPIGPGTTRSRRWCPATSCAPVARVRRTRLPAPSWPPTSVRSIGWPRAPRRPSW